MCSKILFFIIFTSAFFLRLYNLGTNDLWFDEAMSVIISHKFFEDIIPDRQPPLYYFLLFYWTKLFGYTEFVLRLLSVIFNLCSILFAYKITNLLFDRQTSLILLIIMTFSPFHIWYSQEVRGYTFTTFMILMNTYFFILALQEKKNRYWVFYFLSLVTLPYVNYFALFLFLAQGLCFLFKKHQILFRKWACCIIFSMIFFTPWLDIFVRQTIFATHSSWIPKPSLKSLIITLENFNLGYNAHPFIYKLSHLFFAPPFILGLFCSFKNIFFSRLLIFSLFLPIGICFFISRIITPIYLDRLLLPFSIFYFIFLGYGLSKLFKSWLRYTGITSIMILILLSLNNYFLNYMPSDLSHHIGLYTKKPIKPILRLIYKDWEENDVIVYTSPSIRASFIYYLKFHPNFNNSFKEDYYCISDKEDPYWQTLWKNDDEVITIVNHKIRTYSRIWLISSSWPRDGTLDENSIAVREWMEKNYKRVFEKWFDGILVGLYEKR
ncbi:MAG: glycosyltransferase family 39 protein [Candidatus Omnitrophica bacterium]|nr:glycosyltransferase family 39 protein [Candidatus Omnitrophota bacterium]